MTLVLGMHFKPSQFQRNAGSSLPNVRPLARCGVERGKMKLPTISTMSSEGKRWDNNMMRARLAATGAGAPANNRRGTRTSPKPNDVVANAVLTRTRRQGDPKSNNRGVRLEASNESDSESVPGQVELKVEGPCTQEQVAGAPDCAWGAKFAATARSRKQIPLLQPEHSCARRRLERSVMPLPVAAFPTRRLRRGLGASPTFALISLTAGMAKPFARTCNRHDPVSLPFAHTSPRLHPTHTCPPACTTSMV